MSGAQVRRDGDSFVLTWPNEGVGVGMDRFHESRDGLRTEVTVESIAPGHVGRVHGPTHLNLLSSASQASLAKTLGTLMNHTDWAGIVAEACAVVTTLYRQPPPVIDLSVGADPGPVRYLLPGIPEGETTVFYGDGESAKSLFVLLLGVICRSGLCLPWSIAMPPRPLNVMVLDWETTERTVMTRFRRIAAGLQLSAPPARFYYREMHTPLQDAIGLLRADRSKLDIDVFIADSLSFACSGSLNDDETARSGMNALRQLAPATRVAVAHVSQETARASHGTARPFGSAFFWNGMRSGWEVRRAEESPTNTLELGLYHRKGNDGQRERPFAVRVEFDGLDGPIQFGKADLADSVDLLGRTSLSMRIRAALRDGALSTSALAEELEEPENKIRAVLGRMPDTMRVEQGGGRGSKTTWGLAQ